MNLDQMGLAILRSKWAELSSESSEPSQTKSRVASPEPSSDLTPSSARAKLQAEPSRASSWFPSPDPEPQAEPEPRAEMSQTPSSQPSWAEPSQAESGDPSPDLNVRLEPSRAESWSLEPKNEPWAEQRSRAESILALNQADSCTEPWAGKSGSSGSDQILMNKIGTRSPLMLNPSKQHFGSRKGRPWLARPWFVYVACPAPMQMFNCQPSPTRVPN